MKRVHLFVIFLLVIFVGNAYVLTQGEIPKCSQKDAKCKYSWECCTGCCNANGLCDAGSETCAQDAHPCLSLRFDCSEGETCRLFPVTCVQAPCPPLPMCLSLVNPNPCTNVTCDPGSHCEVNAQTPAAKNCANPSLCPPEAACVKDNSMCQESSCPDGSTCLLTGKRRVCFPSCDRFPCPEGSRCSLQLADSCNMGRCDLEPKCIPTRG